MEEKSKKKSNMKIEYVLLQQAVGFCSQDCKPIGMASTSYTSKDYQLEPHPIGVKVKKKDSDEYGMILGSANIKQIFFKEE